MSHEEAFDRAVEDDHFDLFVSFERRNDLIELGNGVGTKDVERRMINRYSPIMGRAPRKMYLLHARCRESFVFHLVSPMNAQPFLNKRRAAGKATEHCSPHIYVATSKMISSSTGVPSGRLATPYTEPQGLLAFPKTSCSNSEAASATFG